MIQPTRCSIELNRECDTSRNTGSQAKEKTKAKTVTDAEEHGVRYEAGKQPQRTVLSTQYIVGQIDSAQHIKASTCDAYERGGDVVHAPLVDLKFWCQWPDDACLEYNW